MEGSWIRAGTGSCGSRRLLASRADNEGLEGRKENKTKSQVSPIRHTHIVTQASASHLQVLSELLRLLGLQADEKVICHLCWTIDAGKVHISQEVDVLLSTSGVD
jgi:hypothetical protein